MMKKYNVLLVYPEFPFSFWGGEYALEIAGKKATTPPLGLLTVAALFPDNYNLMVIDMNVEPLSEAHVLWADIVGVSSMVVQQKSQREVIALCNKLGRPVFVGGPYPTTFHDEIEAVDHFVLGEVEEYFYKFLEDLEAGQAKALYKPEIDARGLPRRPNLDFVPLPRFDLINLIDYFYVTLQFSRGCPFTCEFCDIPGLYGRVTRTKSPRKMLGEFQYLYDLGYRGDVFIGDDNLIGNKRDARLFIKELAGWQAERDYPFSLSSEASVNVIEIEGLLDDLAAANFGMLFFGVETPNPEALTTTKKVQNYDKEKDPDYLRKVVRLVHSKGIEVTGGFIAGLDGDGEDSFDAHLNFIQQAGIPVAMYGLLTVIKGAPLYERYLAENRLLGDSTGDNLAIALNYIPELPADILIAGYKRVLGTLYSPNLSHYFERCLTLFENLKAGRNTKHKLRLADAKVILKAWHKHIFSRHGYEYLKFVATVLRKYPEHLAKAIHHGVIGYHFQKMARQYIMVDDFRTYLDTELDKLKKLVAEFAQAHAHDIRAQLKNLFSDIERKHQQIHASFHPEVKEKLLAFQVFLNTEFREIAKKLAMPVPELVPIIVKVK